MDIFLLCLAAAYMIGGKYDRDKATAAYKAGKEPPGLVKARMRHQSRGGTTTTKSGEPKGPGATRMLMARRWSQACERAADRSHDKHRRWRQWYAEQAPTRDEEWRRKHAAKIAKKEARTEKFARARGLIKPTTGVAGAGAARAVDDPAVSEPQPDTATSTDTTDTTPPSGDSQSTSAPDRADQPQPEPESPPTPVVAAAVPTQTSTDTTGVATVYQEAAAQLHNRADVIDGYRDALAQMGDDMAAVGWGNEVSGPLSDMHSELQQVAGRYRDLADQMLQQGDNVNDAYEAAPWAPDKAGLVRQ